MAVARKPVSNPAASEENVQRFIAKAAQPAPEERAKRIMVTIRFDADLLARVDRAARRRGISRAAWVQYVASSALDNEAA
jgi:uncharacterized protein (DUF4415 family)